MDFGLTFEKLLLIGVIAAVIIGPERLPKAAETFAGFVRRAGEYLRDTKSKMRDEIGPEIDDVDWRKLDPRQYDPRRIIREALVDDDAAPAAVAATAVVTPTVRESAYAQRQRMLKEGRPAPFDDEAT